jgi:long-subunit fatty acid transport protein
MVARIPVHMLSPRRMLVFLLAVSVTAAVVLPVAAFAQTSLGDQRVGTSSASFLRIGVGARAVGMGGAYVAICDGVTACAWNPAGLIHVTGDEVAFNYTSWPADIKYSQACYGRPIPILDGTVAVQFGSLTTNLMETTEYHPYGTGREFSFTDWLVGVSLAKRFTDRFSGGFGVKYVREELGVEVGGPVTNGFVMDAGTYYEIGPRDMRLAVALTNFGSDLTPGGTLDKRTASGFTRSNYEGFAPATEFRFGIAFEPVKREWVTTLMDIELCHPADNEETFRLGGEAVFMNILAVRAGQDTNADELKTSIGFGVETALFSTRASLDYAATFSDYLGTVHRFSLDLRM